MSQRVLNVGRLTEYAIARGHFTINKETGGRELYQTSLARAMGVTCATISRVLSGDRKAGGDFILGLMQAFPEVNADYFFDTTVTDRECESVRSEEVA
jgi:transcriptional regulator with XRE-family HTH domain